MHADNNTLGQGSGFGHRLSQRRLEILQEYGTACSTFKFDCIWDSALNPNSEVGWLSGTGILACPFQALENVLKLQHSDVG